ASGDSAHVSAHFCLHAPREETAYPRPAVWPFPSPKARKLTASLGVINEAGRCPSHCAVTVTSRPLVGPWLRWSARPDFDLPALLSARLKVDSPSPRVQDPCHGHQSSRHLGCIDQHRFSRRRRRCRLLF